MNSLAVAAMVGMSLFGNTHALNRDYPLELQIPLFNQRASRSLDLVIEEADIDSLREKIKNEVLKYYPSVFVFGNYLDSIEHPIKSSLYASILNGYPILPTTFKIEVPESFLVDNMSINAVVSKKQQKLFVYQDYNGEEILVLEANVGIGGEHFDSSKGRMRRFDTPSGQGYIKRFVKNPYWTAPSWAEFKGIAPPGPKNPFGNWMAEIFVDSTKVGYEPNPPNQLGRIRLHSSNASNRRFYGIFRTHGCISLDKNVADELFTAMLHYLPHDEPKTNERGTIYPLKKPFPILITNE